MAVLVVNTRLWFFYTPCTRDLSKRWSNCSKYTKISSQVKKLKAGNDVSLSPEQLDRIARNKSAALERLSSRCGPVGVGESWKRALGAEFTKPYFISVIRVSLYSAQFSSVSSCSVMSVISVCVYLS